MITTVNACSDSPLIPLPLQIYEVYGSKTSTWRRSLIEINLEQDVKFAVSFASFLGVASGGIAIDDVSIQRLACKYG